MLTVGDTSKRRQGLALRAGAHDDDFLRRNTLQLICVNEVIVLDVEVAELAGDIGVLDHGATRNNDFSTIFDGSIADLLHAMNMRCTGGDDDASFCLANDLLKRFADFSLGRSKCRVQRIGGIAQHEVNADITETSECGEVRGNTINRRLIELEVTSVEDIACGALDEYAHCTRDGVVYGKELNRKTAHFDLLARYDLDKLGVFDLMLCKFALDEAQRELGSVNGHLAIKIFQEVRQRTSMVFVAVGDHDAAKCVCIFEDVGVVRKNEVDARMAIFGEHEARIVENEVSPTLKHGHILANCIKTTKGDDAKLCIGILLILRTAATARLAIRRLEFARTSVARKVRALALELNVLESTRLLLCGIALTRILALGHVIPIYSSNTETHTGGIPCVRD